MGWEVNVTSPPLYPRKTDSVFMIQKAGWTPGPVWTGAENRPRNGFQSPDHPACDVSIYRLSYPDLHLAPGQESVERYLQFSSITSCIDGDNFSFVNGSQ